MDSATTSTASASRTVIPYSVSNPKMRFIAQVRYTCCASLRPRPAFQNRFALFQGSLDGRRIIEQNPFNNRNWQTSVLNQIVMELPEPEIRTFFVMIFPEQIH